VKGTDGQPVLNSLPRGRHGLPRKMVTDNQRARLIRGMIQTVAARGYGETTVVQVTGAVKISRRTFYENFVNKADCFSAAYEVAFEGLLAATLNAADKEKDWADQVRARLRAILEALTVYPERATFFLISPTGVDDVVAHRHHRAMREIVSALTEGAPEPDDPAESMDLRTDALAGGLSNLIVHKMNAGQAADLPELLPALVELVLRPFLGSERAVQMAQAD
jgi:AcrR family transcriptional regulator